MKKTLTAIILATALGACAGLSSKAKVANTPLPAPKYATFMECLDRASDIKYVPEGKNDEGDTRDYWQTPRETEKLQTGDCEDMAFYLQSELEKAGIDTSRVVFGLANIANPKSGHAWLEYVAKDGTRFVIDPTAGITVRKDRINPFMYYETGKERFGIEKWKDYLERLRRETTSSSDTRNLSYPDVLNAGE